MGCATTMGQASRSELIITRIDKSHYNQWLSINEGRDVKIKPGQTLTFKIPNGLNMINGSQGRSSIYGGSTTFECENERIEMTVDARFGTTFEIRRRTALSQPQNINPLLQTAIAKSFGTLNSLIPNGSRIAVVNITPANADTSFIQDELMLLFVNSQKFTVVDRQTLDAIREEQRFQMTGEVSDETAISIGHFLGADVVLVGSITGNRGQRRLLLKALDVKTARVLAMSSEEL